MSWFWPALGNVLIFSFLLPFTGGQGQGVSLRAEQGHFSLTFRQRSRVPQGRPLCMPIATDRKKAMESKGQSKRNRSNMESDFVLPCYSSPLSMSILQSCRIRGNDRSNCFLLCRGVMRGDHGMEMISLGQGIILRIFSK